MEGFKCALGKLLALRPVWHSRAARKHLLQIRASLECFTKSALSLAIVPRAIHQHAAVRNVTRTHPIQFFPPTTQVVEVTNQNLVLHFTFLVCQRIICLMDEIVVCVTVVDMKVSADRQLINTPFLSNEMIHSSHLQRQYFTAAILCQSLQAICQIQKRS